MLQTIFVNILIFSKNILMAKIWEDKDPLGEKYQDVKKNWAVCLQNIMLLT